MVYAAQKGADENAVQILDEGLRKFADVITSQTGKDIAAIPAAGAASDVAAGLMAFLKAATIPGAKMVIKVSKMEDHLKAADLITTGEGKLDRQSSEGKLVQFIAALGRQYHIPVIALCGTIALDEHQVKEMGLLFASSMITGTVTKMTAKDNPQQLLSERAASAFTFFRNAAR